MGALFPDGIDINKVVKDLDVLLAQGYNTYSVLYSDYPTRSSVENFNLSEYSEEKIKVAKIWTDCVCDVLRPLSTQHYLFHFLHPRTPVGIGLIGVPQELSNLKIHLEYQLYALEEIILRLEENASLLVRKEIAEKEYQSDILYEISYSDHTREVKLNNIVLAKPDFNSENDNCFSYIYKNPNRPIGIEEFDDNKPKKRLAHIVRDLGFVNELKDVFFPVVTKDKIMFVNPITKQYFFEKNLPPINFKKIVRQSEEK